MQITNATKIIEASQTMFILTITMSIKERWLMRVQIYYVINIQKCKTLRKKFYCKHQ